MSRPNHEKIIEEYNQQKDGSAIEPTFEALMKLVQELYDEAGWAVREELDRKSLAIFYLQKNGFKEQLYQANQKSCG
jgi:hypothetical protein